MRLILRSIMVIVGLLVITSCMGASGNSVWEDIKAFRKCKKGSSNCSVDQHCYNVLKSNQAAGASASNLFRKGLLGSDAATYGKNAKSFVESNNPRVVAAAVNNETQLTESQRKINMAANEKRDEQQRKLYDSLGSSTVVLSQRSNGNVKDGGTSLEQAEAICIPQAKLAGRTAADSYTRPKDSFSARCRKDFLGNYNCSGDTFQAGGKWTGALNALNRSDAGRDAYNAVFASCMATFG